MSSALLHSEAVSEAPKTRTVETKLEVIVIPVSDVDHAKRVYADLGWRPDAAARCARLSQEIRL